MTTAMHSPQTATTTSVMFYDRDCGFCAWTVSALLRFDRNNTWRVTTIQEARDDALASIPDEQVFESWHVRHNGVVSSGGAALADALRSMPLLRPAGWLLARLPRVADVLYRAVSGRRAFLARLIPERSKQAARDRLADPRRSFEG